MKTEKYIVEIEMPDGDHASPLWVKDVLQSDTFIEDSRWKVSAEVPWKPSEEQIKCLEMIVGYLRLKHEVSTGGVSSYGIMKSFLKQLKEL